MLFIENEQKTQFFLIKQNVKKLSIRRYQAVIVLGACTAVNLSLHLSCCNYYHS